MAMVLHVHAKEPQPLHLHALLYLPPSMMSYPSLPPRRDFLSVYNNGEKAEILAMDGAPHFSFTLALHRQNSTPGNGQARTVYKCLGANLFTSNQTLNMIDFITNEITAFFTHLGFTHSELVLLINVQLTPILTYRLMVRGIPPNIIMDFENKLWAKLCAHSRLAGAIPPKDPPKANRLEPASAGRTPTLR